MLLESGKSREVFFRAFLPTGKVLFIEEMKRDYFRWKTKERQKRLLFGWRLLHIFINYVHVDKIENDYHSCNIRKYIIIIGHIHIDSTKTI